MLKGADAEQSSKARHKLSHRAISNFCATEKDDVFANTVPHRCPTVALKETICH